MMCSSVTLDPTDLDDMASRRARTSGQSMTALLELEPLGRLVRTGLGSDGSYPSGVPIQAKICTTQNRIQSAPRRPE